MSDLVEAPPSVGAPEAIDRPDAVPSRAVEAVLSKAAGSFRGGLEGGIEWSTQRDIDNPNDEAGEGVAGIADHYGVGNFYRMLASDQEHDEAGLSLANCGKHLLAAKLAHVADDHDGAAGHVDKAMTHFAAFHQAMKAATED
jgi:hypothetical protein